MFLFIYFLSFADQLQCVFVVTRRGGSDDANEMREIGSTVSYGIINPYSKSDG